MQLNTENDMCMCNPYSHLIIDIDSEQVITHFRVVNSGVILVAAIFQIQYYVRQQSWLYIIIKMTYLNRAVAQLMKCESNRFPKIAMTAFEGTICFRCNQITMA